MKGFTIIELAIAVAVVGILIAALYSCVGRRKDCQRVCDSRVSNFETNTYGSDKCWCADNKGGLQLKKVY